MQIDVSIGFFLLGVAAVLAGAKIEFPKSLYQALMLFLMIAIGLKGGVALAEHASWALLTQSIYILLFGLLLPFIAFPILHYIGLFERHDAASIAAHYGSVSVGTYAVAVAYLESKNIAYEAYIPLFVVLLEMPAIVVGIMLAKPSSISAGNATDDEAKCSSSTLASLKLPSIKLTSINSSSSKKLLHEMFFNQGIVLMVGSLVIGFLAAEKTQTIAPLFFDLFNGVLALFLLEMGMVAASRLSDIKRAGSFILAFSMAMPLIGGTLGCGLGVLMGLSSGGVILIAVLGASASYIAVPAAMRVVLPHANHSVSISASLGITFPFNVILGIPVYTVMSLWFLS
ncbi:sodium-dependent bicarbonate transport family permease [Shewanella sp. TC10]|uniref:sodium-dependent bicarbonate transport family permease n=1 Tax=Shewanella sp. TC10 TaxID=1419739 RepID=UPI00129EA10C|nr:sodium-dependent bicarbonate transport family permease [Shewanella sp. TC10]